MKIWIRLLLLVSVTAGAQATQVISPVTYALPEGVQLLHAGPTGMQLEWVAPSVEIQLRDDGTAEVLAEGYPQTEQPGAQRLPFASALIAIPLGVVPQLRILSIEDDLRPLPAPLALAPRPEGVVRDGSDRPIAGTFAPVKEKAITVNIAPAVLEEIGIMRGVRLGRLTLHPVIPEEDRLRVIHRLRLEIHWAGANAAPPMQVDAIQSVVRQSVLNPWDAIPTTGSPRQTTPLGNTADDEVPTALIEVTNPGIYRVSFKDLEHLGLTNSDPHNLRLFRGTDEVAFDWEGDADDLFETGETLAFYAEPHFSRWTDVDVYRLVADSTPGARMTSRSADPTGLPAGTPWVEQTTEENHIYTPDCFCGLIPGGRDGDRWVWTELRPDKATASFPFLTTALDASQPATLTLWFIGKTDVAANPDHRVDVTLNNTYLDKVEWNGKQAVTNTLSLTPHILQNGPNTLTLTLPGITGVSVEGAWLDGFAVRYARSSTGASAFLDFEGQEGRYAYTIALTETADLHAYDVTDPLRPQSLTDMQINGNTITMGDPPEPAGGPHRYSIASAGGLYRPARIRAPEDPWTYSAGSGPAGADMLIITHPDFVDALGSLVNLRENQGLATVLVNVLGIYDNWGDGRIEPEAIRTFIAEAYASWDPRPAYVILVGDGSFDPKGYQPESPTTFIPPYLADADDWAGESAADNRYACVDGDDTLPDLMLGRLPVETIEEARTVVDKIIDYETDPLPGEWNANVILVADDADKAGDFATPSEEYAAAHLTPSFTASRHYCSGVFPNASDCSLEDTAAIHTALLNGWNQGALLIQFTGHSSWHQWALERFWHLDDLAELHNGRRLPVVLGMTCFTSAFQRPERTLDEDLITLPGSGAVAAWGPTGLGVGTGHSHLSDGFFRAVFQEEVETVGAATMAGKLTLAASGQYLDLLDTFILQGDPALKLNRTLVAWPSQVFLPTLIQRP